MKTPATLLAAALILAAAPANANAAVASCYGPGLYGNRMANGETLTSTTIGAAHRTLELGTRLYVRANRRTVLLRITDRGPFIHGRSLDLTNGAANRLGYSSCYRFGVRRVRSWLA